MGLGNSIGFNFANNMWSQPMMTNFNSDINWGNNSKNWDLSNTPIWSNSPWTTATSSSTSKRESAEEYEARIKKELAQKKQNNPTKKTEQTSAQEQQSEDKYWKLLTDDYTKSLTPSESFMGAAAGGAAMGIINNPRLIAHPINSVKGFKDTKQMFAKVTKKGSKLNLAWKSNAPVMEEAYAAMQKLSSRHNSKIGLFRKRVSDGDYKRLKNIMNKALKSGDINKVAEATAKLKCSYVNDGYLPRAWQKVKGLFGRTSKVATVSERLGESTKIAAEANKIIAHGKGMSFKTAFKSSGGIGGAALMAAIEVFMAKDKIKAAFNKDKETGWEQVKQTAVKAVGSAGGWALGQSLGTMAWAAWGAKIGTLFGPGVGTLIGAGVGLVAGSIGCYAAGLLTHYIMGDYVGDKCLAEQKAQTNEGKVELLQNTIARAQNNEIKDKDTLLAVQALANKYNAIA